MNKVQKVHLGLMKLVKKRKKKARKIFSAMWDTDDIAIIVQDHYSKIQTTLNVETLEKVVHLSKNGKKQIFNFGFCGTQQMMEWIKIQVDNLVPAINKDVSIHQNGNSETNKKIIWRGIRAIEIHKRLRERVYIPWKLERKWNVKIN